MIVVNMAMKQEDIKSLLAEHGFKFVKKQGIRLFFETPTDDAAAGAAQAKAVIKASEWGAALFFNVEVAK